MNASARNQRRIGFIAIVLILLAFATPTFAADGVIQINQAGAIAGGVTAGDSAGFPVTISEAGSYRLTSNLVLPDANTSGILLTTGNLTIDLNGFGIIGPGTPGTGDGISGFVTNVAVLNGTVTGLGDNGVNVGVQALIENVRTRDNGNNGIGTGAHSKVINCSASNNGGDGYKINGGNVVNNIASGNGDDGIRFLGSRGILQGNTAISNGGDGIQTEGACTVIGNHASDNTGFGLNLNSNCTYFGNNLIFNTGGTVSGGFDMGHNACNGNSVCP
jgi:parallel beta-helix repeat protein